MANYLRNFINKISSHVITFDTWILSVFGIVMVRIFLEQYSNRLMNGLYFIDFSSTVIMVVYFLAVIIFLMIIVIYFMKMTLREAASFTLILFPVIWIAPIIDIILHTNSAMLYPAFTFGGSWSALVSMFWDNGIGGATPGIRAGLLLAALGIAVFTYVRSIEFPQTKKFVRAICAGVCVYIAVFIIASGASLAGLFQNTSPILFIQQSLLNSNIINNFILLTRGGLDTIMNMVFSALMTQINLLFVLIGLAVICWLSYREKAKILLKNIRLERISHYSLLVILGVIMGGGRYFFSSWVNVLSLVMTVLAFACAWIASVLINDIYDKKIDNISNNGRPIPSGFFTDNDFAIFAKIFLLIAFFAAYSSSMYGLFFVALSSFAAYLYSVPPFRFKRNFVSGSLIIGLASVSALLSGYFLASTRRDITLFPPLLVFILILVFGAISMIKDFKDYDGDKADSVKTLPVLIGLRHAKIVTALLISLSALSLILSLQNTAISVASIVATILVWFALLSEPYKEKRFFAVYLTFLVFCGIVMLLR